jgi:tight adherence protein C
MWSLAVAVALVCLWTARRVARPVSRLRLDRPGVEVGTNLIAACAALGGLLIIGPPGLLLAAVPFGVERLRTHRAEAQHEREIVAALPPFADLLAVAVTAGHGVPSAIERVGPHVAPVLAPFLDRLVVRVARGAALRDELHVLSQGLGQPAEPLMRVLDAALVDGVGSAPTLRAAAVDLRLTLRRTREAEIAALPVRLLFPLVVCILPAFVLLTLVPMLIDSLGEISTAL